MKPTDYWQRDDEARHLTPRPQSGWGQGTTITAVCSPVTEVHRRSKQNSVGDSSGEYNFNTWYTCVFKGGPATAMLFIVHRAPKCQGRSPTGTR